MHLVDYRSVLKPNGVNEDHDHIVLEVGPACPLQNSTIFYVQNTLPNAI